LARMMELALAAQPMDAWFAPQGHKLNHLR
jgi:hypothetical protein